MSLNRNASNDDKKYLPPIFNITSRNRTGFIALRDYRVLLYIKKNFLHEILVIITSNC